MKVIHMQASHASTLRERAEARLEIIETIASSPGADSWFSRLTPKAQKEYIKTHPNSKYAKNAKKAAPAKKGGKQVNKVAPPKKDDRDEFLRRRAAAKRKMKEQRESSSNPDSNWDNQKAIKDPKHHDKEAKKHEKKSDALFQQAETITKTIRRLGDDFKKAEGNKNKQQAIKEKISALRQKRSELESQSAAHSQRAKKHIGYADKLEGARQNKLKGKKLSKPEPKGAKAPAKKPAKKGPAQVLKELMTNKPKTEQERIKHRNRAYNMLKAIDQKMGGDPAIKKVRRQLWELDKKVKDYKDPEYIKQNKALLRQEKELMSKHPLNKVRDQLAKIYRAPDKKPATKNATKKALTQDTKQALKDAGIKPTSPEGKQAVKKELQENDSATKSTPREPLKMERPPKGTDPKSFHEKMDLEHTQRAENLRHEIVENLGADAKNVVYDRNGNIDGDSLYSILKKKGNQTLLQKFHDSEDHDSVAYKHGREARMTPASENDLGERIKKAMEERQKNAPSREEMRRREEELDRWAATGVKGPNRDGRDSEDPNAKMKPKPGTKNTPAPSSQNDDDDDFDAEEERGHKRAMELKDKVLDLNEKINNLEEQEDAERKKNGKSRKWAQLSDKIDKLKDERQKYLDDDDWGNVRSGGGGGKASKLIKMGQRLSRRR